MASTRGRAVVVPLTNKSGGSVAAGDVVVVDTSNNEAFTTSTAGAVTGGVGIAQETIANNASGRVLIAGYAALVNVNASVTRGNYGKTHTVAKQATDAGASRVAGTFCQFLTGGTTPTARVFSPDLGAAAGNVAADAIWDAAGDLAQGTGADTAAKLSAGTAGKFLMANGSSTALTWAARELDYVQFTSSVNVTATVEASANTIVTANAVSFDGSTVVEIVFVCPDVQSPAGAADVWVQMILFDGSSAVGVMGFVINEVSGHANRVPVYLSYRLTPSNASHTYSIRGIVSSGTAVMNVGAAGSGTRIPGYIRILRAV